MPAPHRLLLTRRRALAGGLVGGLVGLAASGCDAVTGPSDPAPTDRRTGRSEPAPSAAEDPDEELVADVRRRIAGTAAVVTGAARGRPALARELRDLARLHRRHLDALPGDTASSRRVPVSGADAARRRRVRNAETRLQRQLADAAVEARSGPLAALLASMSAAVAQQLAADVTTGSTG